MSGWRKKQILDLIDKGEQYNEQKALDRAGDEFARRIDREAILQAGLMMSDGGYSESTHEKQQVFDRARTRSMCNTYLSAMLGKEELVELWWNSANLAFKGDTPNKVFEEDHRKVFQYILDSQGGW